MRKFGGPPTAQDTLAWLTGVEEGWAGPGGLHRWFNADPVVHCGTDALLGAQVAFGGLHRCVAQATVESVQVLHRRFGTNGRNYGANAACGISAGPAPNYAGKLEGTSNRFNCCLGHASVQTTERYLGTEQNLTMAVNDTLGLEMG